MQKPRVAKTAPIWAAVFLIVMAAACATAGAADVTLTFSDIYPATHPNGKLAMAWGKEVEKRTDGRVRILHYPGQSLTNGRECYDGVVQGLSDLGQSVLQYTRGRFPLMDVINLPLGYPNGAVATAIINELNEKFHPAELQDTQVMVLHAHGPGYIHTRQKVVRRMEDLQGLKIRSHGPTAEMLKLLGATPVAFPMPELYQALQKGVVNGGVYPMEADRGWKLAEVADHVIVARPIAYSLGFFIVMNKGKWNALPPDIQQTIQAVNLEFIGRFGAGWDEQDRMGRSYFLEQGGQVIEIDAGEAQRWAEAVRPVVDVYQTEAAKRGLPGKEVVAYVKQRLADYEKGEFHSRYMLAGQ
jgi:TRAP-type transport system periplasmic protein